MLKQLEKNAKSAALFTVNAERAKINAAPLKQVSKMWWGIHGPAALKEVPAAACPRCGGWHGSGGMSQFRDTTTPVLGRVGCICYK